LSIKQKEAFIHQVLRQQREEEININMTKTVAKLFITYGSQ